MAIFATTGSPAHGTTRSTAPTRRSMSVRARSLRYSKYDAFGRLSTTFASASASRSAAGSAGTHSGGGNGFVATALLSPTRRGRRQRSGWGR